MKKKQKKKKSHVPFRLNMLFFCVFLMFSALILRLGVVQIVYGEDYKKEVERTENTAVSTPVPRGKIYDRYYRTIVDNTPLRAVTYTRMTGSKSEERLQLARKLIEEGYIKDIPIDKITERDKKDFWVLLNKDRAKEKITAEEQAQLAAGDLDDKELYQRQLERIEEDELGELTEQDLKVLAIKRQMDSGYALVPQIIKKDVTTEEYAKISESLDKLPGIDTTTDWERNYKYEGTFRTVLGNVSSADEGLPSEYLDHYLVRDYSRNDRVGKSYIEQTFEDVLHGTEAKVKNVTDTDGNILETIYMSKGQRGNDLVLTVDIELQKKVEQIIEEELKAAKAEKGAEFLDRAFVVMMNPKNGDILSMAGKMIAKKDGVQEIQDFALGTMTSSYAVGSAVKGATILTGFETGAIEPATTLVDEPIVLKGTPKKSSYETMGPIDDLTALQRSSNVYMFKTAMRMAGTMEYVPGMSLSVKPQVFDTMRYYFSQFGLGVPTGIDLPNESTGYKGTSDQAGLLLDLAIGQYDTYTTLQLAQYVSTVANGGYRVKPQILKEVRQPTSEPGEVGRVLESTEPVILNRVDMNSDYISRVQEGFRLVMMGRGTGAVQFEDAPYEPAGKTGTAQTFYDGPVEQYKTLGENGTRPSCYNLTLVGYAPYNNPEVAFAVVVPWMQNDKNPVNKKIGRRVLDAYFELRKQGVTIETSQQLPQQETTNQ